MAALRKIFDPRNPFGRKRLFNRFVTQVFVLGSLIAITQFAYAITPSIPQGDIVIELELVCDGLTSPVYATGAGDRVRIGKDAVGGTDHGASSTVVAAVGFDPEDGGVGRSGSRGVYRLGRTAEVTPSAADARVREDRVAHSDSRARAGSMLCARRPRITSAWSERCALPR